MAGRNSGWEIRLHGKLRILYNFAISGFTIGKNGALAPLSGTVVAILSAGSTDLDMATSSAVEFLYTLNSGTRTVGIFGIDASGALSSLGEKGGLPPSAGLNGIAAI